MAKAKQLAFLKYQKPNRDHGGSLSVKKRRARRPLNIKQSHHITMKSFHAIGSRSLFRHKKMILSLVKKNAHRFHIKVIEYAIQGNHIHLLVKAQTREGLQNFFRVVAGHVAQRILKDLPLPSSSNLQRNQKQQIVGGAPQKVEGCKKNQRRFWSFLLYSRIISWGHDYERVIAYIQRNTLELLNIITYQPRRSRNSS